MSPASGHRRGERRVMIALGGNALAIRNEPLDATPQIRTIARAVEALAPLSMHHQLLVAHGNGPQVGLLALESSADASLAAPYPLDALVAETQGLIGYWLLAAMQNALPNREFVAMITRTLVDAGDSAFGRPSKFVGPTYTEDTARGVAARHGWTVERDGAFWRRVVASPVPTAVLEIAVIERLVDAGVIVVCGGGGGIPMIRGDDGRLDGVEAVVDKDLTAALIAESVHADFLLLLTDVAAVETDFGQPGSEPITRATPADLRHRQFAAGSMGPKIDAVCRFVERTGGVAAIGALEDAGRILAGEAGTIVTPTGYFRGHGGHGDLGP